MATTSPRACSAWGDAELLLGGDAVSTDTPLPIKSARASSPAGIDPILLHEADRAVADHHRDDRPAELRHLADAGQRRGDPEQQREEVNELGGQMTQEARPSNLRESVRTGLLSPRGGLLMRQVSDVDT
jgi:hypothetical protein